ncbi:MAG: phosphatidate cytidylyltransferase [Planctomycetota bacterium]|nr:phosphatidate cytidylyltransferase [Planctomycetota bacterium]
MSKKAKIIRRTIWGGGLALALGVALWATGHSESGAPLAAIAGIFGLLGCYELSSMGALKGFRIQKPLLAAGVITLLVSFEAGGLLPALFAVPVADKLTPHFAWLLLGVPAVIAAFWVDRAHPSPFGLQLRIVAAAGLSIWVGFAFGSMHELWSIVGQSAFVCLLVLSKIGDVAGYYVGSAIGKSHPFKGISPGKTTAGCNASLLVTIVTAIGMNMAGWLAPEISALWAVGLFGAAINIAAQAGDLFESWIKRRSGVKDSGTWFGPSGGVLDLVDSLLFTIPAALLCWPLLLCAG